MLAPSAAGWSPSKVATFEQAYWDFLYHVRINSKEGGGNYRLIDSVYEAQRRLLRCVFDGLSDDIHDFKILKSRQLGCTTITRSIVMFWLGVHAGMQGAMVFDTTAHLEEARQEIRDMIAALPPSLKFPSITGDNRYAFTLSNNSRLRFMAAGVRASRTSGVLGRSSGLNLVAASEMCSWENEEGITSLRNALSKNYADRLYIWESTARGFNSWNQMWLDAKKDDLNQRTCFIGWWGKDDQRIRRGTAKFERYGREPPNETERRRIALVKELYGFAVDPEQLAWYRELTDPNREMDDDDPEDSYLLQDQPWTEDEAFQQSGSTFFDASRLSEISTRATTYKAQGFKFWPGQSLVSSDIVRASYYREVELRVWEEPDSDATYVVSCDPAFGASEHNDRSCIQVLRCYADQLEQVAEYTSSTILTHQLAWLCWCLVGWYGSKPNSSVMFFLEINGPGEAVWKEYRDTALLLRNGYLRDKAREKGLTDLFQNARNYVYSRSDSMGAGHNWQWKTQGQLRVAILERLRDFVHAGWITIRSMEAIEEMKALARDGDKIEGPSSIHDDRAMSLAFGIRAFEDRLRTALVINNRTKEADQIARRRNPQDLLYLFNRNTLDNLLKAKESARIRQQISAQRASWRWR